MPRMLGNNATWISTVGMRAPRLRKLKMYPQKRAKMYFSFIFFSSKEKSLLIVQTLQKGIILSKQLKIFIAFNASESDRAILRYGLAASWSKLDHL